MSITLTTGVLVTINGTTVENDVSGFVTNYTVDFMANQLIVHLAQGTVSGSTATIGAYGTEVVVQVNMTTGVWSSSNGKGGTITGATFTSVISQLKSDRNLFETFAAGSSSIMPGTQVAWT